MRFLELRSWKVFAACLAVASIALLAGQPAEASNMGFKMNKAVAAQGSGQRGTNLVSLPFRNPYANASDVCTALNLTNGSGRITQINAQTGATLSYLCGDLGPFTLRLREGFIATNPTATSGIIVGSHIPGQSVSTFALGSGVRGTNLLTVLYHTTAVNAQDVCNQASLTAGVGRVTRINAPAGTTNSHLCGDLGAFNLVLGEALVVTDSAPHTYTPSHF